MKKLFLVAGLLGICSVGYSQFSIKGQIKNYDLKPIVIKVYQNGLPKFLSKVETDKSGKFCYKVPFSYQGVLDLELSRGRFELISDNSDIDFNADYASNPKKIVFNAGVNKILSEYNDYKTYLNIKDKSILPLQAYYKPNQEFYKALEKEKQRIDKLKPVDISNSYPGLSYYLRMNNLIDSFSQGVKNPSEIETLSESHLLKDDLRLENYGFLPSLVTNYLSNSISGARSREEAKAKLKTATDNLLNAIDIQTSRGQSVLLTVINLLRSSNFKDLVNDYISKASSLTCEINPSLKSMLKNKDNVAVGKKVPNIVFDKKIKGVKSLYDIKSNKKLLIFWGSWCGHCQHEWPFIKAFYPEFKKQGGEIIAFAVDLQKENILPFINGTDWYNYSDFLKWDSPIIKEFGVTGTPTMILLDKDNKVIKIGNKVSEFSDFN